MEPKTPDKTTLFASMVAAKRGWVLNPDADFVASLVEGLTVNWNRYGYFLCPCRDSDGSRESDARSICPCAWSGSDVEEYGHCYCGLYEASSFASSGREPRSIPDGRYARP